MKQKRKSKSIKIEREWLGITIPTALEMVEKGLNDTQWYIKAFGLTPQAALKNIIQCLRNQAEA